MKKLFKKLMLLTSVFLLTSCSVPSEGTAPSVTMTAVIDNISDRIEVTVLESEYTFGVHWVITSSDTEFIGKNGEKITRDDLSVGDKVEIAYSGQVMMSYPPQIVGRKITVIS